MVTIGGKVWPAMVVAILIRISMSHVANGLVAQTSTTTPPAAHAKKPASKSGTAQADAGTTAGAKAKGSSSKAKSGASGKTTKKNGAASGKKHIVSRKPTAQTIHLNSAFKASEQLRPMAQQLALTRSPAAYSGVQAYAR